MPAETFLNLAGFVAALRIRRPDIRPRVGTAVGICPVVGGGRVEGDGAGQEGFIRIHGGHILSARQFGDHLDFLGDGVNGHDRAVRPVRGGVKDAPGLVSHHDDARPAAHHRLQNAGLEVDQGNAVRGGDHHPPPIGRKGVQVEIQALAARIGGKLNDPVAGVRVNPRRQLGRLRRGDATGEQQAEDGQTRAKIA